MSFRVITRREEMNSIVREIKLQSKKIGFVPTMGALHKGHTKLIENCALENEFVIVSVFVNPIQFGANEDLSKYPRTFEQDCNICEENKVDILFAPTVDEMYPNGFSTQISLNRLSTFLCGKYRVGHFDGVATVVLLLLNLMKPDRAYFGQKDFQQVQIIKQMCADLACDVHIEMVPTVREKDGLALSSRNIFLNQESRELAQIIPKAFSKAAQLYLNGERSAQKIIQEVKNLLLTKNLTPQYLEIRSTQDLTKKIQSNIDEDCVLAIAQFIQTTPPKEQETSFKKQSHVRLIDNIILSEDSKWVQILKEFTQVR